jgi:hypothetical protein
MSIFVTTTKTGTLRAKARPKCSLVMPTIPALAPIINIPKSGTKKRIKNQNFNNKKDPNFCLKNSSWI